MVTALLALATLAYCWPLPTVLSTHTAGDQRDPLLTAALLHHVFRSLVHLEWGSIWDAPIFFPNDNTLAYSESFLGTAWYGVPLYLMSPDAIWLQNTFHITGVLLSALGAVVLGTLLTNSVWCGAVAGVVYGFSPFRLVHLMHVQMMQAWGVPLAFAGLVVVVRGGQRAWLGWVISAVAVALQVLSSSYLGLYTLVLAAPVVLAVAAWRGRGLKEDWRGLTLGAGLAGLLLYGPVKHYQAVQASLGFERSLDEIRHFSARAEHRALLPAGLRFPPGDLRVTPEGEFTQWMGRAALALTLAGLAAGLWRAWRARRAGAPVERGAFLALLAAVVVGALCVWLSLGPGGSGGVDWTRPYSLLMAYAPGFKSLRVPSRFYGVLWLALATGACLGVAWLLPKDRRLHIPGALAACLLCALDVWPRPMAVYPLPDGGSMGPVLTNLSQSGQPGPILEVPYRLYWRSAQHDLNTTRHHRVTANGYSGVETPLALALRYLLPSYPLSRTDELVQQLGVNALVLHRGPPRADVGERVPFLEELLAGQQVPTGTALQHNTTFGAWLTVTPAQPGPIHTLAPVWTSAAPACAVDVGTDVSVRVDLPVSHAVVSPNVRHPGVATTENGSTTKVTLESPPVGLLPQFIVTTRVPRGTRQLRLLDVEAPVTLTTVDASQPATQLNVRHNVPAALRTAQGLWMRVEVEPEDSGISAADHDVRLQWVGAGSDIRPKVLPLRTHGARGCPAVAEGVVEFLKGTGPGVLLVAVVHRSDGRVVGKSETPLMLSP